MPTEIPDGSAPPQSVEAKWYPGQIAARDQGARQPPQPQPAPQSNTPPAAGSSDPLAEFPADVSRAADYYVMPDAAAMLPEGMTLPEGTTFTPNAEMIQAALPILHKHKVSRDAFHDLVRIFNQHEVTDFQTGRAYLAESNKELGPGSEGLRKALAARMRDTGAGDFADVFASNAPSNVVQWLQKVLAGAAPRPPSIENRWYGGRG